MFASLSGVFSLLIPLKYYILFFLSVCLFSPCSLPAAVLLSVPLLRSPPPLPRRVAIRVPLPCLRLSSAPAVCSVPACRAVCPLSVSPFVPVWRAIEAPRRPSVCRSVCRAACPSLVSYQAQNAMTVGADAPRICPRLCPCLLLPMCCRGLFRCLSCCLLPCVVWW